MIQAFFLIGLRFPRIVGRIYRRLAAIFFRRFSISFSLDGSRLLAPADHLLPFFRREHPGYSSNLGRLVGFLSRERPHLRVIDIGANIGDSVAIIRAHAPCPILCVEGEPRFLDYLKRNLAHDAAVAIEPSLIGSRSGSAGLVSAGGTASVGGNAVVPAGGKPAIPMITCDELLERHPLFDSEGVLKIDTDGFEFHILSTATGFLARRHPVLFIEFDPHFLEMAGDRPQRLTELLIPAGYGPVVIYDHLGDVVTLLDLTHQDLWEDLITYLSGRGGRQYVDLCIFPSESAQLARQFHLREREECLRNRRSRSG